MATSVSSASTAGASQVVVTGTPVEGGITPEGKALADRDHAAEARRVAQSDTFADRLADSGLAYWDDNVANRMYIAKLDLSQPTTPIGTPTIQVRRLLWPDAESAARGALEGVMVMREDGTFYSIPAGVRSLAEVTDPNSGEALVGDIDPKKAKARAEAAANVPERAGEPRIEPAPEEAKPKAASKSASKGKK